MHLENWSRRLDSHKDSDVSSMRCKLRRVHVQICGHRREFARRSLSSVRIGNCSTAQLHSRTWLLEKSSRTRYASGHAGLAEVRQGMPGLASSIAESGGQ
jgi:hypothetical protein